MPEMTERVAKAIEALGPVDPANYRDRHAIARAAVEAMCEPTEAMRAAALNTGLPKIGDPPLYEKLWRAMLAKA